jgi:hypothetical protein
MATPTASAAETLPADASEGMIKVQKAWELRNWIASEIKKTGQQLRADEAKWIQDLRILARDPKLAMDPVLKQTLEQRYKAWSTQRDAQGSYFEALDAFFKAAVKYTEDLAANFPIQSLAAVRRRIGGLRDQQKSEEKNAADLKKEIRELKHLRDQLKKTAGAAGAPVAKKAKP